MLRVEIDDDHREAIAVRGRVSAPQLERRVAPVRREREQAFILLVGIDRPDVAQADEVLGREAASCEIRPDGIRSAQSAALAAAGARNEAKAARAKRWLTIAWSPRRRRTARSAIGWSNRTGWKRRKNSGSDRALR